MVKLNRLLSATALVWGVMASSVQSAEINTNVARMQAMDKITGMVRVIDVPINSEVKYGTFSIVVRACKTRPPEETPENFAFVDVVDNYKSENPVNIFRGWMISSSPSLNPVEHPIYDIWLLSCDNDKVDPRIKIMTEDELKAREQIPQREQNNEDKVKAEVKLEENNSDVSITSEKTTVVSDNENAKEKLPIVDNKDVVVSVKVPTPAPDIVVERNTEEGPKALIQITEPAVSVQNETNDKKTEQVEEKSETSAKTKVEAAVVINAPEEEKAVIEPEKSLTVELQEPALEPMEEAPADDPINTDEIEENGMLDDQLIDFSE